MRDKGKKDNLGLIQTNKDRFLLIKENKLSAYLALAQGSVAIGR